MRAVEHHRCGELDDRGLARAIDRATVEIAMEMIAAGVEVISDGQLRWPDAISYICAKLAGFDVQTSSYGFFEPPPSPPRAMDRIGWERPIVLDDYRFLSERSPVEVRPVLTGPFSIARRCDPGVYGTDIEKLTYDLAVALNRELEGLSDAGAKYILIEEPLLTRRKDEIEVFVEASEMLCAGITAQVMLGTAHGDLVGIEDALLETGFAGFGFDLIEGPENEMILSRTNFWEGRIVQLGLVNARNERLESAMEVALGLIKYSKHHDPGLIWAAPTAGLIELPRDLAFKKITNLCAGADWSRHEMARREEPGGRLPRADEN